MKKLFILLLTLACIVSFFFFVQQKNLSQNLIRVGILKHESSLPFYVAEELGLFRGLPFKVELVELPPGDHMPALLSNRVDILSPTSFPVLFGLMNQNPGAVFAVFPGAEILNGPTVYGLVVKNTFSGKEISDLQKQVVMAINPYTQINIKTIFSSANIQRENWPDIRVANRDVALKAVADGTAQAAIMDQPALAVALTSGDFKLLVANPRAKYIGTPYWSGSGAVTCSIWEKRRDDFLLLLKAIDESIKRIRADSKAAHQILAKKMGIDEKIAEQMGGYYFPLSDEAVPLAGIDSTVDALVSASLLPQKIEMERFFPPGLYGMKQK